MSTGKKYELREDFLKGKLEGLSTQNPMEMFADWMQNAIENDCFEPHTVTFSTVAKNGGAASRILYMREMDDEGFIMYTNYTSRKGEEIIANPNVALLFHWPCSQRQVRIEGRVDKVSSEKSDEYFNSRPRKSKIGAWASNQSTSIESRAVLNTRFSEFEEKFPNEVPRPPHWGGLKVIPTYFEFWQGREGRLHDRYAFDKINDAWKIDRLAP